MKITKVLLAAAATLFMVNSYAQTRDEIATKMNSAGELLNKKNYTEAISTFKESLEMLTKVNDPAITAELEPFALKGVAGAYRMIGMTKAHGKDFKSALVDFTEAAKFYKQANDIMMLRKTEGLINTCYTQEVGALVKVKKFAEAADVCMAGIAKNPNSTALMILAAQCYEKANNEPKSIEMYEKVMALGKKYPRLRNDGTKALNLLVNGKIAEANELMTNGKTTAAMTKVGTALKYNPSSVEAMMVKMAIYNKTKNYKAIVTEGPAMAAKFTDDAQKSDMFFKVGAAYVALGDNKSALENYSKVKSGSYLTAAADQIAQIKKNLAAAAKQ